MTRTDGGRRRAYQSWHNMIRRCQNPKTKEWKYYGGRGITVCDRWLNFANFHEDMGDRPDGLTIERRDNNGNYNPNNCKWATPREQNLNKRVRLYADGVNSLSLKEWAKKSSLSVATLYGRLRRGWPIGVAIRKGLPGRKPQSMSLVNRDYPHFRPGFQTPPPKWRWNRNKNSDVADQPERRQTA